MFKDASFLKGHCYIITRLMEEIFPELLIVLMLIYMLIHVYSYFGSMEYDHKDRSHTHI